MLSDDHGDDVKLKDCPIPHVPEKCVAVTSLTRTNEAFGNDVNIAKTLRHMSFDHVKSLHSELLTQLEEEQEQIDLYTSLKSMKYSALQMSRKEGGLGVKSVYVDDWKIGFEDVSDYKRWVEESGEGSIPKKFSEVHLTKGTKGE